MPIPTYLNIVNLKTFPIRTDLAGFIWLNPQTGTKMRLPMTHLATATALCRGTYRTYIMFQDLGDPRWPGSGSGNTYVEEYLQDAYGNRFEKIADEVEARAVIDYMKYHVLGGSTIDPKIKQNLEKTIEDRIGLSREELERLVIQTPQSLEKGVTNTPSSLETRDEQQEAELKKQE